MHLCDLLLEPVKRSMDLLRSGEYNRLVESSLPFWHRTGVVKRSIVWDAEPSMKENIHDGLPRETFLTFQDLIESGSNDEEKIGRIKAFTGNDFLKACAIGYSACGYDGGDRSLTDQYLMHADGRDEGLTGKGYGLEKGPGIDLDDPAAWDKWYSDKSHWGGHPWEVCRGGNSTHIDLYVCHDRDHIRWRLYKKEISEKQAEELEKEGGYYFAVAGDAWTRAVEAVKFYVALKNTGLPVVIRNADAILSRFKGDDYIGIVPHMVFPAYCESMFPDKYGKILDFMHIYQEDMDKYGSDIEWLMEDEAELIL